MERLNIKPHLSILQAGGESRVICMERLNIKPHLSILEAGGESRASFLRRN